MKTHILTLLTFPIFCMSAQAVVLFGLDNSATQSDPNNGLPFQSVGRTGSASGVYVGNGYVLTANHVNSFATISFDNGVTSFTHDGQTPIQIGNTDMKLFKLTTTPTVAAANLYQGTAEILQNGYIVGAGLGRDATNVGTTVVPWGNTTTIAKRWGTNVPNLAVSGFQYTDNQSRSYTFDALLTTAGSNSGTPAGTGNSEGTAAAGDSGGALFQKIDNIWYLTGLTTLIVTRTANSATFGNDVPAVVGTGNPTPIGLLPSAGDPSIFVRVGSYSSIIAQAIPETSTFCLISLFPILFGFRRRR